MAAIHISRMAGRAFSRMATTGRPNGRPAKPVEVKRATGNPGHRALPPAPSYSEGVQAVSSAPTPPPLGVDGAEMWAHVWSAGRSWLAPDSDYTIVTLLCQAQDEMQEIRRALSLGEVPRFYVLSNGQQVTHPLVNQLKDLRTQTTAWLAALGFSPSDRARLGLAEVRIRDELDELQRRREERRSATQGP